MEDDQCEGEQEVHSWTPGQMVRHIIGTRGNEAYTAVAWSNRGRAAYKAQWGYIRSTADGLATIRAGHDALRHCANAPWFEWLEGSASFFGNDLTGEVG